MQTSRRVAANLLGRSVASRWCFIVAALVSLAFASPTFALDPSRALTQCIHRIWQVHQGLPQGTIYCIAQTHDRYLWLGTKSGLARFDGVQFTLIRELGGLPVEDIWVRDLWEDADHALWIATDGDGLIRWQDGKAVKFTTDDGLPSNSLRCVRSDGHGNLWIGTDRGLARYAAGKIDTFADQDGLGLSEIRALGVATDGKLWIAAHGNQLHLYDDGHFTTTLINRLPDTCTISALCSLPDGSLWIGSSAGLVKLQAGQQRHFTTADGLPDDQIYCLTAGGHDSLWIGAGDGFSRYHDGKFQSFTTRDGLSQSTVYCICEDHEGSLWVGTKLGLNQFADRRSIPFTVSEGLPSNNTGPIVQDRQGDIWIGTLDAGLARFNGAKFSTLTRADGLPCDKIISLAPGSEHELWVGTNQGLSRVESLKVAETFTTQDGLPHSAIRSLCQATDGRLWIGTAAGIAARRDGKFVEPANSRDVVGQRSIAAIIARADGSVVAAADDGAIFQFSADGCQRSDLHGAHPAQVTSLFEPSPEQLLIGTADDGLFVVLKDRTVHLSVRDGLYDDELFGIAADGERLWFACSKGVFSVTPGDLQAFIDGKLTQVDPTPLSPLDALRTVECQQGVQPTVERMRDGRLWFATIRGVLVIDPSHWQRTLPPTSVVIEEVVINGKSEDPLEFQSVPPGNANLSFHYAALSFVSPTRISFRYRLEGFDKQWIDAGSRREAFYTNIPPGTYRFVVAATNADGKLYETAHPVEIKIAPHLWQTVWFLPACLAAVALAAWMAYRLRVRAIRRRMNVIIVERSRIARELHDGLMQGFSGITMEMQALSSRLPDESPQRKTLEEIIGDAGHCLREARRSIAGLRGAQSGLAAAIEQSAQQLAQTQDARLKMQLDAVPNLFSAETQYNLLRIAQEAIANSLKHSGARTVEVALENAPDEVRLIVRDDGKGFEHHEEDLPGLGHYGLIGMRERARQIGAAFHLDSRPGRGTTVRVSLPKQSSAIELAGEARSLASGSELREETV